MTTRRNRVASVFFPVASHAAETPPPLPRSLEHKIQHAKCGFWYNYYELGQAHAGFHGKAQDHRMKSESKRKILVAGMGSSPAVLTNAVWALAHHKKPVVPDEIAMKLMEEMV